MLLRHYNKKFSFKNYYLDEAQYNESERKCLTLNLTLALGIDCA
jgi:hypothetical protein